MCNKKQTKEPITLQIGAISLAVGDTVIMKKTGETGIITESEVNETGVDYGFNLNCWYTREDFIFVSRATKKTLKAAIRMYKKEQEYDNE